ncbi:MAG TPA: hypothetical protein VMX55_09925 [candidate division Zixibacteria bacterium]|nr:hypothetical protein [candidate division Zixibacteria bacterium]
MTFLRKKIQEDLPEPLAQKVFQLEDEQAPFEDLLQDIITSFSVEQLNLILEFEIENEQLSNERRVAFLRNFLRHEDPLLREKAIQFLEPYLKDKLVPLVESLISDPEDKVRVRVYWVLAKYTENDELTLKIIDEFNFQLEDNEQIFLAAALYQCNNSPTSIEMRFLSDFYHKHYFDLVTNELKVSLTGKRGYAAQIIGLILWEAGIKLIRVGSLEAYDLRWLIDKGEI